MDRLVRVLLGLAALGASAAAPASAQLVFEPPATLETDVLTEVVVAGDLDGDGLDDAALIEGFTVRRVRALISQGDGSFAPSFSVSVGTATPRVDLVDVDGDGLLDLAYPDNGFGNAGYAVHLGAGDGTFGAKLATLGSPGPNPRHVAFVHLDDDGVLDMAVVNVGTLPTPSFPPDLDVLLGDGDGTFTLVDTKPLPTTLHARGIAAGDVDGDRVADLAIVMADGTVRVHRGLGDGLFSAATVHAVGSSGSALRLVDVDADGQLDLLVADDAADAVVVRLGAGEGVFGPASAVPFGDGPNGLVLGDLDSDGVLDLVVTQTGLGDVGARRGLGDGTFGPLVTVSGVALPASPALAQLDADSRPDLVLASTGELLAGPDTPGALVAVLNHTYGDGEPFLDLGFALAGAAGYPILLAEGTLVAGAPYAFTIANGPANGVASLVVGVAAILAPFKGGTYVPFPNLQIVGLPLDGTGTIVITGAWPALGSGFDLYMQSWAKDAGGPQGWVSTSGVKLSVP